MGQDFLGYTTELALCTNHPRSIPGWEQMHGCPKSTTKNATKSNHIIWSWNLKWLHAENKKPGLFPVPQHFDTSICRCCLSPAPVHSTTVSCSHSSTFLCGSKHNYPERRLLADFPLTHIPLLVCVISIPIRSRLQCLPVEQATQQYQWVAIQPNSKSITQAMSLLCQVIKHIQSAAGVGHTAYKAPITCLCPC